MWACLWSPTGAPQEALEDLEELPELGVLRALLLLFLWGQSTFKHPQGERHAAGRCLISLLGGTVDRAV